MEHGKVGHVQLVHQAVPVLERHVVQMLCDVVEGTFLHGKNSGPVAWVVAAEVSVQVDVWYDVLGVGVVVRQEHLVGVRLRDVPPTSLRLWSRRHGRERGATGAIRFRRAITAVLVEKGGESEATACRPSCGLLGCTAQTVHSRRVNDVHRNMVTLLLMASCLLSRHIRGNW